MNEEIDDSGQARCIVCSRLLDSVDDVIRTRVSEEVHLTAHSSCVKGLSDLLSQVCHESPRPGYMQDLIRNIDGKMVLTRRDFPNQYIPILLFFSLHPGKPMEIEKLKEWLQMNGLDFSNPSVPIRRLLKRDALAVLVDDDKTSRYFLTSKGAEQLEEYLKRDEKEK